MSNDATANSTTSASAARSAYRPARESAPAAPSSAAALDAATHGPRSAMSPSTRPTINSKMRTSGNVYVTSAASPEPKPDISRSDV